MPPGKLLLQGMPKIDWPRHKINCGLARDIGALFGAQNMDELENKEVWARTLAPFLSRK